MLPSLSFLYRLIEHFASLDDMDLTQTVKNVLSYLRPRVSDKVSIELMPGEEISCSRQCLDAVTSILGEWGFVI